VTSVTDLADLRPDPAGDGPDRRTYRIDISPVFTIGPKVHGGVLQVISAHAATRALRETAPDADGVDAVADLVPVAISTEYLGAPDPAEVTVRAQVRKRGRRISVMDVEIVQGSRTLVHSSVSMARLDHGEPRHATSGALSEMPSEPPADAVHVDGSPLASVINLSGAIALAYEADSAPFVRGEVGEPVLRLWARPHDVEPDAFFALLAGDISAPVVMNLGLFGWAPTLQLTTYVRRMPAPGWLRVQASSSEVGAGWFEEDHQIIDSTGALVAQSRQLALIPADTAAATGGQQ